ncbi:hypothetical protein V1264_024868 [Littorina saxatilis]|uniref:Uncharacterized protein n=1 Tax=Littorina saxatilis TaxID=31220 RepID=A0AAN9AM04_9CAEN
MYRYQKPHLEMYRYHQPHLEMNRMKTTVRRVILILIAHLLPAITLCCHHLHKGRKLAKVKVNERNCEK